MSVPFQFDGILIRYSVPSGRSPPSSTNFACAAALPGSVATAGMRAIAESSPTPSRLAVAEPHPARNVRGVLVLIASLPGKSRRSCRPACRRQSALKTCATRLT